MSQFTYDCNMCVCYSGLVTCTKDSCNHDDQSDVTTNSVERVSGILPGGCKPYYSPVCGINGASYLNPCIARLVYFLTITDKLLNAVFLGEDSQILKFRQ